MSTEMISVVIPVYGCRDCLISLHARLTGALENLKVGYEILFVNDNSPDNSWETIVELVGKSSKTIGINLSRNFGQHYAITAGLDHVKGDWVVVMDCDLQDRPEEIANLYNKAKEGYDVVLGRRTNRQDGLLKKTGSKLFYSFLGYLTDTKQDGFVANFGIYNRSAIDALKSMRENLRFFPIMVKWIGFKQASIDIEHASRSAGESSYSLKKLINLALNVMVSFSDKPLRLTTRMGIAISFFSLVYGVYIMLKALLGQTHIVGWASLIVSMWLLSGLIIFTLGITGIYVSRIFDETKKRPLYIVREIYANSNCHVSNEQERI